MANQFVDQFRQDLGEGYEAFSDDQISRAMHHQFQQETGSDLDFESFALELGDNVAETPENNEITIDSGGSERSSLAVHEGFNEPPIEIPEDPWLTILQKNIERLPERAKQLGAAVKETLVSETSPLRTAFGLIEDVGIIAEGGAEKGRKILQQEATEAWKNAQKKIDKLRPNVEHGSAKFYGSAIFNATADMGIAVTASMITRNPNVGLGIMSGQVFADKHAEAISKGKSEERAALDATFYAMTEALTEKIPLGVLTSGGGGFFKRVLKSVGAEGLQEVFAEAAQIGYERKIFDEGKEMTFSEFARKLWDAGVIGMGVGGTLAVITAPATDSNEKALGREMLSMVEQADLASSEMDAIDKFSPPQNAAQAAYQEAVKETPVIEGIKHSAQQVIPESKFGQGVTERRAGERGRVDRRTDTDKRIRVEDMTETELREQLLTSEVTGIKNRRAYEDVERKPVQVSIDADSLKWVNDNMSPEAGDQMLKAVGLAIDEETDAAFHISGDEFMVETDTEAEAAQIMENVNNRLNDAEITVERPDGTIITKKGLQITHGLGVDKNAADFALKNEKTAREQQGKRAARGEQPPGVVIQAPEGKQDIVSETPAEEVKQPWVSTLTDYISENESNSTVIKESQGGVTSFLENKHFEAVGNAYAKGENVPAEVLAEYSTIVRPDLNDSQLDEMEDETRDLTPSEKIKAWTQWGKSPKPKKVTKADQKPETKKRPPAKKAVKVPWELTREEYEKPVELKPREVMYISVNNKKIEVIQNPSHVDISNMRKEAIDQYGEPGQGDPALRSTEDFNGNRYYWKAYETMHSFMEPELSLKTGVHVDQNASSKSSHRSVIKKALYQGKSVSQEIVDEYPGLVDEVKEIPFNLLDKADKKTKKVTPKAAPKSVARLRRSAETMEKTIQEKLHPASADQNPTARRARMAASMESDGRRLQRLQGIMRNLAEAQEVGAVSDTLMKISSKAEIETLIARKDLPSLRLHHSDIKEVLEAASGLKGVADARAIVKRISGIDNVITRPSQIEAVDALIKAANKVGKKPLQYSFAMDVIKGHNRAKRLEIDTTEKWVKARNELLALEKPVEQATEKEKTLKQLERDLIGNKIPGFFATPPPTIEEVMTNADIDEGMSVLEPEAGNGDMADAARDAGGKVDVIEISSQLREVLSAKGHNIVANDFLEYSGKKYDRIVMNPPFEKQADIDHVLHAYDLLKPGGRLTSVMSESTFFRDNKKSVEFREFVEENGYVQDLPEGAFKKGKFRSTGVKSRIVVIDKADETGRTQATLQSVWAPGDTYVPMLRGKAITDTVIEGAKVPDKPIRREHIIKRMEKLFGVRIYKGRVKGKTRLGFFRSSNSEIRTKFHNDLEVTAHEVTHWVDDRYPAFQKAYRRKPYKDELKGISYDVKDVKEGFAEFGRLYMTQEHEAVERAPLFYDKFVEIMKSEGIADSVDELKDEMHKWYNQGALNRFRSKTGVEPEPIRQRIAAAADGLTDAKIAQVFDALHGLKVAESKLTGTISDADLSPYKSMRLLGGSRAVVKSVFEHGSIGYGENGDIVYTGIGLRQVFEPVSEIFDDTMTYFAARRANELMNQGREHHFEADEIKAALKLADTNPEMKAAFDEYQKFNKRMMDFYQESGLLSGESRAAMEEMNKDYVPFFRVQEEITGEMVTRRTPFKRLKGGTANVADIFDNITFGTATLVQEALLNRAKQRTYNMIENSKDGALFAAKIPTEIKPTDVEIKQLEDAFLKGMGLNVKDYRKAQKMHMSDPSIDGILEMISKNLGDFMTFFTFGHAPVGSNIDSVMVDGKRVSYEVIDPMFMQAMTSLNAKPLGMSMRIMAGFKNTLTIAITSMPDFQIPNLLRDSFNGFAMSQGGMTPVIDSVKGAYERIIKDDIYWEFMANGGGYSSTIHGETQATRRHLESFYGEHGIDYRTVIDTPAKMRDMLIEFNSAFEYGTRLAEYKAMRKKGASMQEASFQGREVSTDFAMRGYSDFVRFFSTTVPFFNARLQGLYRLEREAFESDGKQVPWGKNAGRLALRGVAALTLPSIALFLFNYDDERYIALPEWIKDLHWVIFVPGRDEPYLIPKPFEVGSIFATIPERITQLYIEQNGEKFGEAMKHIFFDTFNMNPTPQIIKPIFETEVSGTKFTGAPVIPEDLRDVESWEQFRPYTSDSMVSLGKAIGVSPLKLQHWVRGYFGTMGLYALMSADGMMGDKFGGEVPTKRIDEIPVIRRFIRQTPYRGTSYEQEFYKLAEETRRVTKTFNKIRTEGRTADLNQYIGSKDRDVLFGIAQSVTQVTRNASLINRAMRQIRVDRKLTGDEKRLQLDTLQQQKNDLMKTAAKGLNKRELRQVREKLKELE